MAINYEPVGWDTTKYFNPTNMNHMDDGIKAACDKADANEAAIADVNSKLGNTDISAIGDGTVTGGLDALNSNLNSIKSCNFKYYGNAYNKTLNIPLNNGASALLISSNFGYGVGGIWFLEYLEAHNKYRASLIFGNEKYTNITSSGASIDVTSSASNNIYVAEF